MTTLRTSSSSLLQKRARRGRISSQVIGADSSASFIRIRLLLLFLSTRSFFTKVLGPFAYGEQVECRQGGLHPLSNVIQLLGNPPAPAEQTIHSALGLLAYISVQDELKKV